MELQINSHNSRHRPHNHRPHLHHLHPLPQHHKQHRNESVPWIRKVTRTSNGLWRPYALVASDFVRQLACTVVIIERFGWNTRSAAIRSAGRALRIELNWNRTWHHRQHHQHQPTKRTRRWKTMSTTWHRHSNQQSIWAQCHRRPKHQHR